MSCARTFSQTVLVLLNGTGRGQGAEKSLPRFPRRGDPAIHDLLPAPMREVIERVFHAIVYMLDVNLAYDAHIQNVGSQVPACTSRCMLWTLTISIWSGRSRPGLWVLGMGNVQV